MSSEDIRKNINSIMNQKINIEHMYSQAEFGNLCGVSKTTVGKWCNDTCPTADKIHVICKNLNISIFEFLGIDNDLELSSDELNLIKKYKEHPELHQAINKLLDL